MLNICLLTAKSVLCVLCVRWCCRITKEKVSTLKELRFSWVNPGGNLWETRLPFEAARNLNVLKIVPQDVRFIVSEISSLNTFCFGILL